MIYLIGFLLVMVVVITYLFVNRVNVVMVVMDDLIVKFLESSQEIYTNQNKITTSMQSVANDLNIITREANIVKNTIVKFDKTSNNIIESSKMLKEYALANKRLSIDITNLNTHLAEQKKILNILTTKIAELNKKK